MVGSKKLTGDFQGVAYFFLNLADKLRALITNNNFGEAMNEKEVSDKSRGDVLGCSNAHRGK